MKKLHIASLLLALLVISGCSQQTFIIDDSARSNYPSGNDMQHFFISGIGQGKNIFTSDVCREDEKVVKVEAKQTGLDVFLHIITLTIYSPRHAKVYCVSK